MSFFQTLFKRGTKFPECSYSKHVYWLPEKKESF